MICYDLFIYLRKTFKSNFTAAVVQPIWPITKCIMAIIRMFSVSLVFLLMIICALFTYIC